VLNTSQGVWHTVGMKACGQEFSDTIIARINRVSSQESMTRTKLSRIVCGWLDWRGANGKLKEMSCRVVLAKLDRDGMVQLPEKGKAPPANSKGQSMYTVPPLCCSLKELGIVELELVTGQDRQLSRIWRGLMDSYHYLGSGPLCGAQVRYLIKSERHGYLGGLAYSASAWRLRARDEWIGWDDDVRMANLHLVIGNSRFLIASDVEVKNLASWTLAKSLERVKRDWAEIYGYVPVLAETFVEQGRFTGASYRAANWMKIGETTGRGKCDRKHERSVPIKDIYVYQLGADARDILCRRPPGLPEKCEDIEEKEYRDWAEEEFSGADVGDERLTRRLLGLARDLYAKPQAHIPQACGSRAKTKAAYRFLDNENVTMEKILSSHYEATIRRMRKEKVVFAVQDTTTLNYSTHPMTEDIGPIASREEGVVGLILHETLAINEEGTPLGLIDAQCWARNVEEFGKKHARHDKPIEEKESNKWLVSYRKASEAQKALVGFINKDPIPPTKRRHCMLRCEWSQLSAVFSDVKGMVNQVQKLYGLAYNGWMILLLHGRCSAVSCQYPAPRVMGKDQISGGGRIPVGSYSRITDCND